MTNNELTASRRILHDQHLWWVGRMVNGRFVPYADAQRPDGYGYATRNLALRAVRRIKDRQSLILRIALSHKASIQEN